MKKIILLMLLLTLAACAQTAETEESEFEGTMDLRVPVTHVVEMRVTDDGFEPDRINVLQFDTVHFTFLEADTFTFVMDDFSIAETVNSNTFIEVTADEKGVYSFECLDCEDAFTGLLVVE